MKEFDSKSAQPISILVLGIIVGVAAYAGYQRFIAYPNNSTGQTQQSISKSRVWTKNSAGGFQ